MTSALELCPKCHASFALTSYKPSYEKDFVRAYRNPTQSEASCIEKSLGNTSADMAALAQEIPRLESILDALKAYQARFDRHIQQSRLYMCSSPIRQLSTEVLAIIFASACTSFRRSEYKTPPSVSSARNGVTSRSVHPHYGLTYTSRPMIRMAGSMCTDTILNAAGTFRFQSRSKFLTKSVKSMSKTCDTRTHTTTTSSSSQLFFKIVHSGRLPPGV
ncbi:hypothetical protein CPB85DRAFT_131749 [Mucidula mucida]|nr:hypothetical protein CPB85DRAFT_131749 [Mucidula mucida]